MKPIVRKALLLTLVVLSAVAGGCAAGTNRPGQEGLTDRAAEEATAIIRRAEATAIVLRAQATAAALVQLPGGGSPTPAAVTPVAAASPSAATGAALPAPCPTPAAGMPATRDQPSIQVLGVGLAGEGAFVNVLFTATPKMASGLMQGTVQVIDEATGAVHSDIVVMPSIGALLARPVRLGQPGYVMLTNVGRSIRPGSVVTVVLGGYRREHVVVD